LIKKKNLEEKYQLRIKIRERILIEQKILEKNMLFGIFLAVKLFSFKAQAAQLSGPNNMGFQTIG
jgi:hypothetical protein